MKSFKQLITSTLVGGWGVLALAGTAVGQGDTEGVVPRQFFPRGDWQRRVVQPGRTPHTASEQAMADQYRIARRPPYRPTPVRTASAALQLGQEDVDPGDDQFRLAPLPTDTAYGSTATGGSEMYGPGPSHSDWMDGGGGYGGCSDGSDGGCGGCGGCYGGCGLGLSGPPYARWMGDLSLLVGVHGFKGPFDQGRNGNFGLHEGVNFGAPLGGPWGLGYQVGFAAVHSNFSGDQTLLSDNRTPQVRREDRDQFFFTAGLFRRALCGGWQWGVAFDLLRDSYYARADLKQIRSEIGYVFPGGRREIGYLGAFGVGDDEIVLIPGQSSLLLEPTDMFALYYRRHFEGGGDGRLWAGFTGVGDGLLGADLRIPLGRSWAIENRICYLIPEQSRNEGGQREESWGLTIQLVWYLGQPADCVQNSPFRPMFGVADNAVFMSDTLRVTP